MRGFKTSWNSKSANAQNTLLPAYGTSECFLYCTGKKSYKEHGNRLLLIWLHGALLAHQNPVKRIYEDLVEAGFQPLAGKLFCGAQSTLQGPLRDCSVVLRSPPGLGRCGRGAAGGHSLPFWES